AGVRARRWTSVLVVAELALTLVLLGGAGFMMRSFLQLYQMDIGIETAHLLTMRLMLPDPEYPATPQRPAVFDRREERLHANARIQAVTVASSAPLQGGSSRRLMVEGRPLASGEQPPLVTMLTVDQRYFDTIGLRVTRGRPFTALDGTAGHENA